MKTKKSSMLFVLNDSSTLPHASEGGQFQIVENKENRITIDSDDYIRVDRSNLDTGLTKIGEIVYTNTTVTEKIPVFATPVGETLPDSAPGTDILYYPQTTDPTKDCYPFKAKLPVYERALQTEKYNQEVGFYIGEGGEPQNIEDITLLSDPVPSLGYIQYGCYGDVRSYGNLIMIQGIVPSEISKIEDVMVTSKDSALDAYYCKK